MTFARSPIAAALGWHGYLCIGRGLIYLKTEFISDRTLVCAEYFSQEQYWSATSELGREQSENQATYSLISEYCPLEEYSVS